MENYAHYRRDSSIFQRIPLCPRSAANAFHEAGRRKKAGSFVKKDPICREELPLNDWKERRRLNDTTDVLYRAYVRTYIHTYKGVAGGRNDTAGAQTDGSKIWHRVFTEFDRRLRRPIGRKQRASRIGGEPITIYIRATTGHTRYPHCGYTSFLTLCACAHASVYDTHHRSQ